jgi:hypothetical protein
VTVICLVIALLPLPVEAGGGSQALCVAEIARTTVSPPGLSLSPSYLTFTSHGETGSINYVGSVNGHAVTGPGTLGHDGVADGTCLSGTGSAVAMMTIPTTGGSVHMRIPVEFSFVGGVGQKPAGAFPGAFLFHPTRGDCVTTPLTEFGTVIYSTLFT